MSSVKLMSRSLFTFWTRGTPIERLGYLIGASLVVSGFVHLAILGMSGGSWQGPLSLRKPATFGLSFGLTLITIVWVSSFLMIRERRRALLLGIFAAACAMETTLVSLQAWRGVPSHFNVSTTLDAFVAQGLAAGGATLVAIVFVLTATAFRPNPGVPESLRFAIRVGFVALCGAMIAGAAMIARGMTLVFGGTPQAAYALGGYLKPTHAVTMHAILVFPAIAWMLSFVRWDEPRRLRIITMATAGYTAVVLIIAAGNVRGFELEQMGFAAEALAAIGALSIVVAVALTVAGIVGSPAPRGIEHM